MKDVSGQVKVSRGGYVVDRETREVAQLVMLTNVSGQDVNGPVSLAFDEFSTDSPVVIHTPTVSAHVAAGSCQASVSLSDGTMRPGQSLSIVLSFSQRRLRGIDYSIRVLAGSCTD